MLKYINSILTSNNSNNMVYKWLVSIALIYTAVKLLNNTNIPYEAVEGFNQSKPYVYKRNEDVYDDFIAEIYDVLHNTIEHTDWELAQIVRITSPDTNNSVFLDIGSGTGCTVNLLHKAGYKAYGVDKSNDMIEYAEKKYPDSDFIKADVDDPLSFERASFTHILCTKTTIYQFKDKRNFFSNCYHWMIPNSYLVVHLVDRKRFSIFEPKDTTKIEWQSLIPKKPNRRIGVTSEYEDFKYKAYYSFPVNLEETNIISLTESFTDKVTNYVRHNEETLYMEDIRDILNMAKQVGFIFHAKVDMEPLGDDNQYLYILERPH